MPENVTARLLGHDLNTMSYGLYSGGVSFDLLSMVSEMELAHIKERQRGSIAAAKEKGAYKGQTYSYGH